MNKFVRFSFWLIFIIAALILTLAIVEPNDVTVKRTIVIRASKETVFKYASKFSNWTNWSTLFSNDSSVKISYSGVDGEPGNTLKWVGDDGITGTGEIKNESIEGTSMRYSFTVTKPGEMLADGVLSTRDTGDFSEVSWTFHKHFPFLANAILIVFDLDKYMGGDFERSLANLQKAIETGVEPYVEIKETEYKGRIVAGIRDTVRWNELETFFGDTYSLFVKTPAEQITGSPLGLFYEWDTINYKTDVFAGYPVTGTDIPVNGIIFSELPNSKAYMATYKGGYSGAKRVHGALTKHIAAKGQAKWLVIEEYTRYPGNEPDSNKWVTNIYYLVQ